MKLTNKHNLPGAIVRAVEGFEKSYQASRGETKISVTQLIAPPLIRVLSKLHWDELEEDVSDRIWSILGSATHSILEHAVGANDLSEERLFVEVDGVKVSGQGDLYEADGTLSDYKITSSWSVLHGVKPEWTHQLNLLAYLYRKAGFETNKLQIVAILRDWSKGQALRSPTYPVCNIKVVPIEIWTDEQVEVYLKARVKLHVDAENVPIDNVPQCTPEERWARPTKYATMKNGRKTAIKLYDTAEEAEADIRGTYVEVRLGEDIRCNGYCPANKFCPYYKK